MKRKSLVKSVLCLILALSVVLCMSGCKGKDDTTDTTDTTEKTTVTPVYYTISPAPTGCTPIRLRWLSKRSAPLKISRM